MSDDNYASAVLLLPMNGANDGTVFTDYSPTRKVAGVYGNVKTVTSQYMYYGSSAYFDGSGDYLKYDYHSSMEFGTGPFTIGCWFRPSDPSVTRRIYGRSSSTNYITRESALYFSSATQIAFYYGIRGTNQTTRTFTVPSISADNWHYLEFCRDDGGVMRASVDGVFSANTYTDTTNLNGGGVLPLYIGTMHDLANYYSGYMQDFFMYKGVALHTSDFTPPGKMLYSLSGTVTDTAGNPAARTIVGIPRIYPEVVPWTTISDAGDGSYSLYVPDLEISRLVLADETSLYNDIVDRVLPG